MSTVLLTGGGGVAIPGLIERLRSGGHTVFVADMDPLAAGLQYADKGFQIPAALSEKFVPAISRICMEHKVEILVPLVDEELLKAFELEDLGVQLLLPRKAFVETCLDKYLLMQALGDVGIPAPKTVLASDGADDLSYPIIVKPRTGRGSRGLGLVNNADELSAFLADSDYAANELILQRCVKGTEFTVSVLCWRDGNVKAVVPKEICVKKGVTHLAVTRSVDVIDQCCRDIQTKLSADGPFNVQLILEENTGIPYPFEINPRYSTTVSLTEACGVPELTGVVSLLEGDEHALDVPRWQEGLFLVRRTQDDFVLESEYVAHKVQNYVDGGDV